MDDVTKRVVTAAEAWLDHLVARGKRDLLIDPAEELAEAVEAYRKAHRPLMERLADLQPGAVVRPSQGGPPRDVLLNHPASQRYAYLTQAGALDVGLYEYVGEIVSEGPNS